MTEAWANPPAGPDLHLDLTSALSADLAGIRSRSRLEGALRQAVQTGRLRPDTRLPPSRSLAVDLGIARNTVAEAYTQLVAEGWLEARVGTGTWVSQQARVAVEAKAVVRHGRSAASVRSADRHAGPVALPAIGLGCGAATSRHPGPDPGPGQR